MLVRSIFLWLTRLQSQRSYIAKLMFVYIGDKCITFNVHSMFIFIFCQCIPPCWCIPGIETLSWTWFQLSVKIYEDCLFLLIMDRDISLGLCECQKDEWESVQKGIWSAVMSPYETRYVDVRIDGQIPDSVTIALEEDLQDWSLTSLLLGLALLFAPIITSRVPFCHSSSLVTVIFPVIVIQLFEVAIFVILSIILAGAALVYSVVSRFVFSEQDGTKAAGVARFVILKWEMRIIGSTFIFQSTIDPPLAKGTLASFAVVYIVVKCLSVWPFISSRNEGSVNGRTADTDEFTRGYFSTYHNLGNREMFTENQWVESTQRYTEQALADLMASPAFIAWLTESTGRIRVDPHEPAKNVSRLGALRNLLPWPWPFQEDSEI
ncbi:uncharacterized protein LOC130936751 isoform X4 [Arachis stenosperma]|uniref:uncharacterized protein LOC130936751 isoform X4 n=1 Tax=Arachis stenosperma TaxID=217475 RepID=UPI0025AD96B2|nr:uncharacterized protein LOC130936751 isoform X4 [Arachis stenosperma]XP_057722883.1 uncharacterized protein LOC130936751 isoform X4 [Arachis stenosperma]